MHDSSESHSAVLKLVAPAPRPPRTHLTHVRFFFVVSPACLSPSIHPPFRRRQRLLACDDGSTSSSVPLELGALWRPPSINGPILPRKDVALFSQESKRPGGGRRVCTDDVSDSAPRTMSHPTCAPTCHSSRRRRTGRADGPTTNESSGGAQNGPEGHDSTAL